MVEVVVVVVVVVVVMVYLLDGGCHFRRRSQAQLRKSVSLPRMSRSNPKFGRLYRILLEQRPPPPSHPLPLSPRRLGIFNVRKPVDLTQYWPRLFVSSEELDTESTTLRLRRGPRSRSPCRK